MSNNPSSLAISWVLSTVSGYGIYGLQTALQFLRRGGKQLILASAPSVTLMPPENQSMLEPAFELARKLGNYRQKNPEELLSFDYAVLHGCASNFAGFPGQDKIWGAPNVGCCAIEHLGCDAHGKKIAGNYDMFIAISKWNYDYLKSLDLAPVHLCYQGVDGSLFKPGPKPKAYPDRFVVFSGGKFEFRKGQDIVLAAFRRFYTRHPDALLVVCWQNLGAPDLEPYEAAGHIASVPQPAADYGLRIGEWLLSQGLPPGSFIDMPFTHNMAMPPVLQDCDAAIFPNRSEGGTNLVAMEAMACGVPTWVSYNTGQKDLVDLIGANPLKSQRPVATVPGMQSTEDWGESDVDEVIEALEYAYTQRNTAQQKAMAVAEKMKTFEWQPLSEKLLRIVCDGKDN